MVKRTPSLLHRTTQRATENPVTFQAIWMKPGAAPRWLLNAKQAEPNMTVQELFELLEKVPVKEWQRLIATKREMLNFMES
jgi:hypothetical protein